jgi:PilY1 beta-propeller domain/FG-GAP-like repeat
MKKFIYGCFAITIVLGAVLFFPVAAQVVTCDEQTGTAVGYIGGDSSTLSKLDGVVNDTGQLRLRLANKGANFNMTSNYPVTSNYRMTGAGADFNNDGLCDLIQGGRFCDNNASASDTNLALFLSEGLDTADPTRFKFKPPKYIDYLPTIVGGTYQMIGLGAGDFDRDGDNDFVTLDWRGVCWIFWNRFIENLQDPGNEPIFDTVPTPILGDVDTSDLVADGYGEYGSAASHWRWETNIEVVDFDGDTDLDVFVAVATKWASGRYGQIVVLVNDGTGHFSRLITVPAKYLNPYKNDLYGPCGIACADFDGDGKTDFVTCSVNSNKVKYYQGDGLGNFNEKPAKAVDIINPNSVGFPNMLRCGDLDLDGDRDFVMATDGYLTTPIFQGGHVYWFENQNDATFIRHCLPGDCFVRTSASGDLDSGAMGDFDGDGDIDFFVADGNDSMNVYFFKNDTYPTYLSRGTVSSNNRVGCNFQDLGYAIVSATLTAEVDLPANTQVRFFLSNSNDESGAPKWEGPVTPGVVWNFQAPGIFLRWMAEFITNDEAVTPGIRSVDLDYTYITKREYSRTSQATIMADIVPGGDLEEVLYSASFEFPSWRGHIRAWDVTHLNLAYSKNSQLQDIRDADAVLKLDAGELLAARPWNSRAVYTAYDQEGDDLMNNRLDFTTSQAATLDDFLGLGEGSPEVVPLIEWVLGRDRPWKLGDINHSSPQALGPPKGQESLMGAGYDAFAAANETRPKVIIAGANDGMLHCFSAETMEELWAFIPNNLLWKLKKMRIVDPDCGQYLSHEFFVDGTPAINDVYFGGSWHTVLVCGQAAGWGRANKCYYFALDITNPLNPLPLWEFTDTLTTGETWSVPDIGKVESTGRWYAFVGSGYDNDSVEVVGNYFYALDIETGLPAASLELKVNGESSPYGIQNTLPGSPVAVDVDNDGFIENVYIGDLLGRLWRVPTTDAPGSWAEEVFYEDPYGNPIITKPAVQLNLAETSASLYFGTGGDERAPNDGLYAFMAIKDNGTATPGIEWFLGPADLATQLGVSSTLKTGELGIGDKVWADPVIANHQIYIATLRNSIENLNPCLNLLGYGKIYARYTIGNQTGGSALLSMATGETTEFLFTKQKVRSAVTIGATQDVKSGTMPEIRKQKIYIQSYTRPEANEEPPSEVLAQALKGSGYILIKSWREIYKIVRF